MKIKIYNIPNYSYEYLVTNSKTHEVNGYTHNEYRLGIKKRLIEIKKDDIVEKAIFYTGKKTINIPLEWYEIIK